MLTGEPNDPQIDQQDLLRTLNMYEAWDIEEGDRNVIIGISDSGVLQEHEDLTDNIFVNEGEIPNNGIDDDGNGHIDDHRGTNFAYLDDGTDPGNTNNESGRSRNWSSRYRRRNREQRYWYCRGRGLMYDLAA